jgi:photosystem II stability/assembly factor-like uncharacterized protein
MRHGGVVLILSRNHAVSYKKKLWLTGMAVLALVGGTIGALTVEHEGEKVDLDAVSPAVMQKWHDGLHGGLRGAEGARAYLKALKQRKAMAYFRKGLAPGDPPPSWQAMGPSPIVDGQTNTTPAPVSGRVVTIATVGSTVYIGAANGGVWRTDDGGAHWVPLTDSQASLAMGSIAVDPNHPSVVYAATGEMDNSGDDMYGQGILKSTDGGNSWTLLGNNLFAGVKMRKIVVDPLDSNHLYLGCEKGFYESHDAGVTWKLSSVAGMSGTPVSTIELDPKNPSTLYVALGTKGIYKSVDKGATWIPLTNGLPPNSEIRRTVIAIAPSNPNVVYVAISNQQGNLLGLFRSDDGGSSFQRLTATPDYMSYADGPAQGNYDNCLAVDPKDPNHIFAGGILLEESTDGGKSWTDLTSKSDLGVGIHVDQHALVYDAAGNLFVGNDGGVWERTADGTWKDLNTNLSITQIYPGMSTDKSGSVVMAGTQDNGTDFTEGAEWHNAFGGDGGYTAIDSENPNIRYCEYVNGEIQKSTDGGKSWERIAPDYQDKDNIPFITPFELAPSNQDEIVLGADRVYRSDDGGSHWNAISQEYTYTMSDGTTAPDEITAVAISPYNPNVIYVGTLLGQVKATFDGGAHWYDETPRNYDSKAGVTAIAVGRFDTEVLVTYGGLDYPDSNHHVFLASDKTAHPEAGLVFRDITDNLPNAGVNSVVLSDGNIYVGTDVGVFARDLDATTPWGVVGKGLPNSPVYSLLISPKGGLIAGTHGRGAYKLPLSSEANSVASPTQPKLTGISVKLASARITVGAPSVGVQVIAEYNDGSTQDVTGSSQIESKHGNVKVVDHRLVGVRHGTDLLTVTDHGMSLTISVTVVALPQSLNVVPSPVYIHVHGYQTLKVSLRLNDGSSQALASGVSYKSMSPNILHVDAKGRIYGMKTGVGYVMVSYGKLSQKVKVIVK